MAVFKARARALDMLGRQQIAGIPTAISELFKNAHDAYANRVEVDYFRGAGLFLLRDDGLGMTREDFEDRWLTLGTESKVQSERGIARPPIDSSKPRRPIMGEKGIGRLSIAIIGSQVLILTRAKRDDKLHDLVAAFIHWGMFAIPGVNLSQIRIPIHVFANGQLPQQSDVETMVNEVKENLRELRDFAQPDEYQRILQELETFTIDVARYDGSISGPSLKENGYGTHFYVMSVDNIINADLDSGDENQTSVMQKTLLGFTNTMTPEHLPEVIKVVFRDHTSEESFVSILDEQEFFTPEEFLGGDHYIKGRFNDFGEFEGTVRIFDRTYENYQNPYRNTSGFPIECGPFSIEFGYVQGHERESRLPKQDFTRMVRKLHKYGGLYVYRDNIRVLPYGDTNVDWLNIEKRRTFRASTYVFSYRRIFGLISISQAENPGLIEKAGREGFRENRAYRQLRRILEEFLVGLARDFFNEGGDYSDSFISQKQEAERALIAKQRDQKVLQEGRKLQDAIEQNYTNIQDGKPQREAEAIVKRTSEKLEQLLQGDIQSDIHLAIADIEQRARTELATIEAQYKLSPTLDIGLAPELRRQVDAYNDDFQRIQADIFHDQFARIQRLALEIVELSNTPVSARDTLQQTVSRLVDSQKQVVDETKSAVQHELQALRGRTEIVMQRVQLDFNHIVDKIDIDVVDGLNIGTPEYIDLRIRIEERVLQAAQNAQEALRTLHISLAELQWHFDSESRLLASRQEKVVIEEELLALREQAQSDLELVQLGMAIDIINHEFTSTITSIRSNLRRLQAWGDANPRLGALYKDIRVNFDHLDSYLTLFTPLHRRLHRTTTKIMGAAIVQYLSDLFGDRMNQYGISLTATRPFREATIVGYPSSFYPVFVNIVDNAIYWLRDTKEPRTIRLHTDGYDLLVSDSGPGIARRDRSVVFASGFSRKPGGRGLGLYISQDILRRVGWNISIDDVPEGSGTTFRIAPKREMEQE